MTHPYRKMEFLLPAAAIASFTGLLNSHSLDFVVQTDMSMSQPHNPKAAPSRWDVVGSLVDAGRIGAGKSHSNPNVGAYMGKPTEENGLYSSGSVYSWEHDRLFLEDLYDVAKTKELNPALTAWAADFQEQTQDDYNGKNHSGVAVVLIGARPSDEAELAKTILGLAESCDPLKVNTDKDSELYYPGRTAKIVFLQLGTDADCAAFLSTDLPRALAGCKNGIVSSFTHTLVQMTPNLAELVAFAVGEG